MAASQTHDSWIKTAEKAVPLERKYQALGRFF